MDDVGDQRADDVCNKPDCEVADEDDDDQVEVSFHFRLLYGRCRRGSTAEPFSRIYSFL